jgi:glycosyltransferase involved in cell wall biosynthesis
MYEGFGLPILEAVACGAPLLISDARALRETAGFDVPHVEKAGSSEAWELALRRRLSSCQLSSGGIDRVRQTTERFGWENTASATIRGYSAFD